MALVLAFLIGCLVRLEYEFLAVSLTVVITFILAQKFTLHGWIRQLNRSDILAILLFIVLTALLLPWLPDRDFGPFGIFNLYRNWLLVVIFLTLHFLTYFPRQIPGP
ncbi:MAG: MgtC/SapB family protein [Saprospiraceae bacterium]|nr:MgtC/SapB family protein [Saprospiraceae bacterium]